MSVKQEANGRRSVEIQFEVAGTPEEVWEAIATGPGISSWFVPATVEERDGKAVAMTYTFGPGMEPRADITEWNPPHRFTGKGEVYGGGAPPVATQWIIEARAGGTCVIRMVHSLFASTDEWDNQLEGAEMGWSGFLRTLRIYLKHFRGQRAAIMELTTPVECTEAEAWETLTSALGLKGVKVGQSWATPAGVGPLGGVVEYLSEEPFDALVRLDTPGPTIAAFGIATYPNGPTVAAMNLYIYGDQRDASVARETPVWQAFLQNLFPLPADAAASD